MAKPDHSGAVRNLRRVFRHRIIKVDDVAAAWCNPPVLAADPDLSPTRNPAMHGDLIDRIYECAVLPELWPAVLERLARIADARGGLFVAIAPDRSRWTASASMTDSMAVMMGGNWLARGGRLGRLRAGAHAGFVTETDMYTADEMAADPFYRDLLWKCGLGWGAGMLTPLPTGETLLLSVERDRAAGPVEAAAVRQLDGLRPHLARAALLAARLHLEHARAAAETLAMVGLPALVVDASGVVLAANGVIETVTDRIQWLAGGRVALKDAAANRLFQQAVAALGAETASGVRSFAVRDSAGQAVLVAHLVPVRGSARDIFSRGMGVLLLTPVVAPRAPPVELVQSLFDLTPAEARVARRLTAGETVAEIAAGGIVSHATVRTQVRGILEKTGCRRQAEVIGMLSGLSVPLGASMAEERSPATA